MKTRTGAVAMLVASLVLVAVAAALGLGSGGRGVGLDVPLVAASAPGAADGPLASGRGSSPRPDERAPASLPGPESVPLRDATRIEPLATVAPPRELSIPSVGVTMPIVATGVLDDGQMELPEDPAQIGWYQFGPGPGERRGSVVLAGHVDSTRYGVGPLARLASIQEGARITVTDAEGSPVRYRVTGVERIRKAALPTDRLFDPDSAPRLVVITCGGRYLPEAGGYEDNIVVIAKPA